MNAYSVLHVGLPISTSTADVPAGVTLAEVEAYTQKLRTLSFGDDTVIGVASSGDALSLTQRSDL